MLKNSAVAQRTIASPRQVPKANVSSANPLTLGFARGQGPARRGKSPGRARPESRSTPHLISGFNSPMPLASVARHHNNASTPGLIS